MGSAAGGPPPREASKPGRGNKLKVAYIGMTGVIVAALISGGVSLYLAQRGGNQPTATSNNKVIINAPPAVRPPALPALKIFQATTFNLQSGQCAYVFSEPQVLREDALGCVPVGTRVEIYCTVESQTVGDSTVWDEIYFRTDWGT